MSACRAKRRRGFSTFATIAARNGTAVCSANIPPMCPAARWVHLFLKRDLSRKNQARHSRLQNNRHFSRARREIVFALQAAALGAPSRQRHFRRLLALPDQLRRRSVQLRDASQTMAGDVRKVARARAVLRGSEFESAKLSRLGLRFYRRPTHRARSLAVGSAKVYSAPAPPAPTHCTAHGRSR